MPSGMGTKLEFLFFFYFFFATQIVYSELKDSIYQGNYFMQGEF